MGQRSLQGTEKRKNLELDENENTTYQNFWDTVKALLRGKVVVLR
jgi:hypothetical protein